MKLYTLGHSNHTQERFVQLLDEVGILAVVDVRTAPASRYSPQFNQANLETILPSRGVAYYFAGQFLGGRPAEPGCYKKGVLPAEGADYLHAVDYPAVMRRDWFVQAIQRLVEIADEQATAIMCSEEDPARCHRHHLISKYLADHNPDIRVLHIRGDSQLINAASLHVSIDNEGAEQMPLF